jgi:hypothetical protein
MATERLSSVQCSKDDNAADDGSPRFSRVHGDGDGDAMYAVVRQ